MVIKLAAMPADAIAAVMSTAHLFLPAWPLSWKFSTLESTMKYQKNVPKQTAKYSSSQKVTRHHNNLQAFPGSLRVFSALLGSPVNKLSTKVKIPRGTTKFCGWVTSNLSTFNTVLHAGRNSQNASLFLKMVCHKMYLF